MQYQLESPEVRKFLTEWFDGDKHQFGQYRNRFASDIDGYIKFIKDSFLYEEPAFQSVQPTGKLRKMFWEFDTKEIIKNVNYKSPELDSIWLQTIRLAQSVIDKGGMPIITYSGRRGFHIWVYTYELPVTEENLRKSKALYKKMIYDIIGDIKHYPDIDKMPLHGNALARIPFSFHQKTGNQVIPLTMDRKPYIPNLSIVKELAMSKIYVSTQLAFAREQIAKSKGRTTVIKNWKIRECLKSLILTRPDHHVNLAFVIDAIYAGKTDAEIHGIYQLSDKYDESKTQYQLDYTRGQIKSEGFKPVSKVRLQEWGICNEDCEKCGGGAFNPWATTDNSTVSKN